MTDTPETHYARSGDVHIAYQILGDGPFDLIYVPNFYSHLEICWEDGGFRRLSERLASFSRLIIFDKRGTGLSDRVAARSYEEYLDDITAVMEAAGSEQAALYGYVDGGIIAMLFAATFPERTRALVTFETAPRYTRSPDYPWGVDSTIVDLVVREADGSAFEQLNAMTTPRAFKDPGHQAWHARYWRAATGPGASKSLLQAALGVDIRAVLPTIRAPTLVMHLENDGLLDPGNARYLTDNIPNAKLSLLPGADYGEAWGSDAFDKIESFLTGSPPAPKSDRVLATVLFVDVVSSTPHVAAVGDRRWREILDRFEQIAKRELQRSRGTLVHMTGDGVLATFDGPARGVRCAQAICDGVQALGLEVRAGLHTGEVELRGDDVGGIAVHIAARVSALAGPSEVLASRTVTDLVAGSGLEFEDRGVHLLKGVPDDWQLYAVRS